MGFASGSKLRHCCFRLRISSPLSVSAGGPPKSLVLHPMSCWQDSRWDSKPARFSSQLWQMRAVATGPAAPLQHSDVQSSVGCWQQRRYDFHLIPTCTTRSLLLSAAGHHLLAPHARLLRPPRDRQHQGQGRRGRMIKNFFSTKIHFFSTSI